MDGMAECIHPRVGVAAILVDLESKTILFGQRKSAHGQDDWCVPGGHLELNETPHECARREIFEETGLQCGRTVSVGYTNDFFTKTNSHYVTLHILCEFCGGQALVKEPQKMDAWKWCHLDELPAPLFLPISKFMSTISCYEELSELFTHNTSLPSKLMKL